MKQLGKGKKRTLTISVVIGILVIVFFVGIILLYYNRLIEEKRGSIIKSGRLAASRSAGEFDKYLTTNIDLIKFTAYTLDQMIEDRKTDEEIQEFLVGQSTAIRNAVFENSTGLYGYINGRFFSGTLWEPPEGYEATARPWYTKPMKHPGELTILEPYVDVQSGNTMLALGKTLCDDVSVISVDISLDQMQKLTEDAVSNGLSDVEMILTGEGVVVTHSDIHEVGKNYRREYGTLGATVEELMSDVGDHTAEFDYQGKHYIAYEVPFQGDWHCISLHNATIAFASIRRTLIVTVLTVIATVLIIGSILAVSIRRDLIAQKALASSEAKSAFLSNMSHEIRTPINAVLGMNEMILRECEDQKLLAYAESVKRSGQTLLGIVNDILDFSKIEAGKMELVQAEYDLASLINDLVNVIHPRTTEKGLDLNLRFDRKIPKRLYGDEIRIRQILSNLLTNAVKYTDKGSITFRIGYRTIDAEPDSVLLEIAVEDTGIGIKEEDQEKIFMEFERIEEGRNRSIEGTGLGMSITRRLLKLMDSSLSLRSEYGRGSVFSFTLKQKVISWECLGDYETAFRETLQKHSIYRETFTASKAEVLVIDDNPMNLTVFASLLKQTKVRIDMAGSGDEGLALAMDKKYDIMFFDHMMPQKDGIETLHELRAQEKNPNLRTPVICLTANAISGARESYLAEGFDDYLTKPIDAGKLEEMMLTYLPPEKVQRQLVREESSGQKEELLPSLAKLSKTGMINVHRGIENSGSVDSYLPLLKIFYTSLEDKAREIETYFRTGDLKNYTIKVHALKSSARIIGAEAFGEDAQALENAGKAEKWQYIRDHHDAFLRDYKAFAKPLSDLFATEETQEEKPAADPELMQDVYTELYAGAQDMDCDILTGILREMEAYRIPDEDRELWKMLTEATERYDYDAVAEMLREYKKV